MAQLDYSIDPNFLMARLDYSFDPNLLMARPNFSIDPRAFSMVEPTKPWPNNPQTTQTFIKNATKTKRTPRPANAFIIYRRDKHFLVTHHDNNVVSKIIAEMWRHETEEIRSLYYQKAEQEKKDHFLKFPDYKYRPHKNSPSGRASCIWNATFYRLLPFSKSVYGVSRNDSRETQAVGTAKKQASRQKS
jgi:hypothetical protein